jgi:hypothetical protein
MIQERRHTIREFRCVPSLIGFGKRFALIRLLISEGLSLTAALTSLTDMYGSIIRLANSSS